MNETQVAQTIITEWLGMFDPPPQIDVQQNELLRGALAAALRQAASVEREPVVNLSEATKSVASLYALGKPVERADDDDRDQVFEDICDELGCAYDNEAVLEAICNMKKAAVERAEVAREAWSASKHDEIIKRLMAGVGMPNSTSLYTAFKQFANELHALAFASPPRSEGVRGSEVQSERAPDDATHMRRPEYITAWLFDRKSTMPIWLIEKYKSVPLSDDKIGHFAIAIDGEFWRWHDPAKFNQMFVAIPDAAQASSGPGEPLQCLRCGTVDAFGPVSAEKK